MVVDKIQQYCDGFEEQFDGLTARLKDIVDGTAKKEVTDWWLGRIENGANRFLCDRGYALDAIPENYLDDPPQDFGVVRRNLEILQGLMTAGGADLDEFLCKLVDDVYVVLGRHMDDIKFVVQTEFEEMKIPNFRVTEQQRISLGKDLEYLLEMQRMDGEIKESLQRGEKTVKKLEMSRVVPVGGLIMARFRILECETHSVLYRFKQLPLAISSPVFVSTPVNPLSLSLSYYETFDISREGWEIHV